MSDSTSGGLLGAQCKIDAVTDQELLRQYVAQGSEAAFDELVRRYRDLIYSSALRQVRSRHTAEDISQAVFMILARKARTIRAHSALGGWLMMVTRHAAFNTMRKQQKQQMRESAAARDQVAKAAADGWEEISTELDAAIAELSAADRDAVIMRFFQDKRFAEIGAQLSLSEEAARKCVTRALDRLRGKLSRRGVTVGALVLAAAIGTYSVQSAPAAMTPVASAEAANIMRAVLKMMAWAQIKLAGAAAAVLLALTGAGIIAAHGALALSGQTPAAVQPAGSAPAAAIDPAPAPAAPQPERVISYDLKATVSGLGVGGVPGVAGTQITITHVIESDQGLVSRTDATGVRTLTDQRSMEQIVFNDNAKTAVLYPGPALNVLVDPLRRQVQQMTIQRYRNLLHNDPTDAGAEMVGGQKVEKYTISQPARQMGNLTTMATNTTIWTDPAGGRIVQVLVLSGAPTANFHATQLFSSFESNPQGAERELSLDPPADYSVRTAVNYPDPARHFSKHAPQVVADALRQAMTHGTALAADLRAVSTYERLDSSDIVSGGPADPAAPKMGLVGSGPGRMPQTRMWYAHLNIGLALESFPNGSWAYLGGGKEQPDRADLIFWCKTAGGYQGVYGDFVVRDMDGPGPTDNSIAK